MIAIPAIVATSMAFAISLLVAITFLRAIRLGRANRHDRLIARLAHPWSSCACHLLVPCNLIAMAALHQIGAGWSIARIALPALLVSMARLDQCHRPAKRSARLLRLGHGPDLLATTFAAFARVVSTLEFLTGLHEEGKGRAAAHGRLPGPRVRRNVRLDEFNYALSSKPQEIVDEIQVFPLTPKGLGVFKRSTTP